METCPGNEHRGHPGSSSTGQWETACNMTSRTGTKRKQMAKVDLLLAGNQELIVMLALDIMGPSKYLSMGQNILSISENRGLQNGRVELNSLNDGKQRPGFVRKGLVDLRQEIKLGGNRKRRSQARPPDRVDYSTCRLLPGEWLYLSLLGVGAWGWHPALPQWWCSS